MMVTTALYPITNYIEEMGTLSPIEVPKRIAQKRGIFSKGKLHMYQGEGIEKLLNLSVKGLHLYHYDFGMVYPEKEYVYPIFLYQVIVVPKRVLVLVHYPFGDLNKAEELLGMEELLQKEADYADLFIKEYKPQPFVVEDIVPNHFNGLIRTMDIDKAYQSITQLLEQWHKGMLQQGKSTSKEDITQHQYWFESFRKNFYHQDYGFHSTKRYLGEKWTKEIFEKYLFNL